MTTDQEDDGVISRWSRRKRGIAVETDQEKKISAEEQKEVDEALEAELLENRQAAEEIDLDTIDEESDLSIFMKAGVPEALKKQALAALWRSNPVFANIDGLNDYDEDFGSSDLIMKTFKSAWQAGKGYMDKDVEQGEETLQAEVDDSSDMVDADYIDAAEEDKNTEDEIVTAEADISEEQGRVEEIAVEEVEEVSMPKVSLRKRLMQEG